MRRVALLVANSEFGSASGIANLRFPQADARSLAEILRNPDIGKFDRIETILERTRDEIVTSVAQTLDEERGAMVLFYYSGHGKVSDSGRLYLAAKNTTEKHLPANGVGFDAIIDMKDHFGCSRFCVVLDCCFAGLASNAMKGSKDDQLKSFAEGKGIFFLGAANSTTAAREDEALGHGVLTAGIIQGLSTGRADKRNTGRITGSDLFAWCCDFASARKAGRPVQNNKVDGDELVIAFSAPRISEETVQRLRSTLTLCWENRMLPSPELDILQTYFFGQENAVVPKPDTLERDFMEYAQGKIRFDELLERRAFRLSERTNDKKRRASRLSEQTNDKQKEVDVATSLNLISLPELIATLVCAAASGLLPAIALFSSHPTAPDIAVLRVWLFGSLASGFIAGRLLQPIGRWKSAGIGLLGMCITAAIMSTMIPSTASNTAFLYTLAIGAPMFIAIIAMSAFSWIERAVRQRYHARHDV
ncbi:hypothetical protein M2175_001756 [Bradyrhizobium elkanii]|uniref:caspase family protein n=1 Tax=Bradyrhizobium TaxID=374 RepID=UPI0021682AB7|nr:MULTISPECIES: caspase family protein [Bradyrhizobium]MCS3926725.1 hypothetical protein [Bradyrhizobium elkanii]MCS3967278.1 hypothetical protein [Bradyrhizobium japonicum]